MIDLHLHLDGSLNVRNVFKMAEMAGVQLPFSNEEQIREKMTVQPDCTNLGEYLEKFNLPLQLLQTTESIEYAVYELMRDLKNEGLYYGEIRFAPQLHLQRGLTQDEVTQAAIRGRNKGIQDFGITTNLILCCMRSDSNHAENLETVSIAAKYLGSGVCAVDLAGNEAAYPTELFAEVFSLAQEKGVPAVIHAGEAAGPESIRHALALGALRIGHGIHAIEDEALMNVLKEKGIFLEMCYTSNLQTKTVEKPEKYPLVPFLSKGLGVTLNTDNLTVSGTSLRREYTLVQKAFSLEDAVLQKIAMNAVQASFMTEKEKDKAMCYISENFTEWLHR